MKKLMKKGMVVKLVALLGVLAIVGSALLPAFSAIPY
jgi:hypothetical protein